MQVEQYELRTRGRFSDLVKLAVLIKNVRPEFWSVAEMQLSAPPDTYRTVSSALRTQVLAAAENDRDGTMQAGGGD